jgi:hypothetical protein
MYSRAGEFRIDLLTFDADGRSNPRNPALLANRAAPGAASLLGGSDHWRYAPPRVTLRRHLHDLAQHACSETGAAAVEVTLHERIGGGAERVSTERQRCRS